MTCCICGKADADCFLQIHRIKAFYHHLKCGHIQDAGSGLTPEMETCVDKLRAYVGLIEITEET